MDCSARIKSSGIAQCQWELANHTADHGTYSEIYRDCHRLLYVILLWCFTIYNSLLKRYIEQSVMSLLCPARICQRIFKLSNSCAISRRCKYDMPSSSPLVTKGIHWDGSLERIQNLVLHEDNHMIVLYKPSTVLMQGDLSGDDNLLDATKRYLW